jgi:hypothetical protein
MPYPVYIICSQSGAIDRTSSLLSVFHIIEGLNTSRVDESTDSPEAAVGVNRLDEAPPLGMVQLYVNAVWMRAEDEEPGSVYEFEFRLHNPDGTIEFTMPGGETITLGKRFLRITMGLWLQTAWRTGGIAWVEGRIREVGGEDWLSQRYPIPITTTNLASRNSRPEPLVNES